jgi:hypothetical protein
MSEMALARSRVNPKYQTILVELLPFYDGNYEVSSPVGAGIEDRISNSKAVLERKTASRMKYQSWLWSPSQLHLYHKLEPLRDSLCDLICIIIVVGEIQPIGKA